MALTVKQRLFVDAYVGKANGNATKAAELAGYKSDWANVGYRLKREDAVLAEIEKRLQERSLTANEVLAGLAEIARGSMADFLADDLTLAWFVKLDLEKAQKLGQLGLIKKLKVGKDGISIELYDKRAALVDLGRHHKLFTDRHEIEDLDEAIERELARLATARKESVPGEAAGDGQQPAGAAEESGGAS